MTRSAKKTDKIAAIMAKKPRAQSRQAKRLILLIKQLLAEPAFDDNQRAVATALNIDPSLPSKFNRDPHRDVDGEVIERVLEHFEPTPGMCLDSAFFLDASVNSPDYRNYTRAKAPARRRKPSEPLLLPAAPAATQASGEVNEMLHALGASARERELFDEHLRLFEYPFVNGGHVKAFIGGLRKGRSLLEATDDAVNASIDQEIKKQNGD